MYVIADHKKLGSFICNDGERDTCPGQGLTHICRACAPGFAQAAAASTACEPCDVGHFQEDDGWRLKVEGGGIKNWWRNGFAKLQNIFFFFNLWEKHNQGCWEVWIYLILFHRGFEFDVLFTAKICGSCFEDFGASSCQRCSTGFYQDTLGQNRCKACPTERTTLGLGAESIAECVCHSWLHWSLVHECWWLLLKPTKSPIIRYFSRRVLVYLWRAGGWNRVRSALFPSPQPSAPRSQWGR